MDRKIEGMGIQGRLRVYRKKEEVFLERIDDYENGYRDLEKRVKGMEGDEKRELLGSIGYIKRLAEKSLKDLERLREIIRNIEFKIHEEWSENQPIKEECLINSQESSIEMYCIDSDGNKEVLGSSQFKNQNNGSKISVRRRVSKEINKANKSDEKTLFSFTKEEQRNDKKNYNNKNLKTFKKHSKRKRRVAFKTETD